MKTKPLTFLLALTFLFLFSGSVYGQEEVKKEYWDNGKLRTEFHYKNKSPTVWTWYYKTGVKQSVERWEKVKMTNYSKSGGKLIEYQYKKGELFSQTNFYPTGLKKSSTHFKNGIEYGIRKEWNEDSKKTFQGNFVDGNEE